MVKEVYHAAISHKGYHQTVPLPSLAVPMYLKNLRRDLRDIVKAMCPHDGPAEGDLLVMPFDGGLPEIVCDRFPPLATLKEPAEDVAPEGSQNLTPLIEE